MSAEFDSLVAEFERFQEQGRKAEARLAAYDGMREEIAAVEAVATSPDRGVTVTAGPGGAIRNIQFTEEALRRGPQALSATVMATVQAAVAEGARRQAETVQRYVGEDLNILDQVLETQAEVLGVPVEQLRSATSPAPRPADPDEDFADRQFARDEANPSRPAQSPPPSSLSPGQEFLRKLYDGEDH
ncbi:YbaB/EbfC family nucleoid-associated protein [Crossiella sp. SN42]|uniref:YbaB/EbfC family nucleoid-associated protein n=1 Tax=Crossiella sp. SN42 TaxID=2944808 RepID=UPI00207D2A12|nr:YbaB/EbfC family nucleoid-associated protein [Crossiella sp. SN42]MCO1581318.1 YbaB/EbfC family nucleoid-associated protein [Crossiella sp. SN42]